jgi:4-diphosphocytidyl-2-C-methyl-D-erythritol kinase
MRMLVVPAYAKVNLALEVTGRRPDGWHDIATVIATIDWHDLVGVSVAPRSAAEPGGDPVRIRVSGPFAEGVPADATNLAVRAADALLRLAGDPPLALTIHLRKEVPSAAGLGGGSADAAAVLRAGATLLGGAKPQAPALTAAAAELGSDVPALLAGGTLLATGRGDILHTLPTLAPPLHLTVAVAGASATAAAYRALQDAERTATGRATALAEALQHDPHTPLDNALLGSALEPAACRAAPGLRDALVRLRALTPDHPWHLTGSGGAAFAVAPDRASADHLAATARAAGFPARACRTVAARLHNA